MSVSQGHRAGFSLVTDVLAWCEELGVEAVTLWLLSTDNLRREPAEVDALMEIISRLVVDLQTVRRWRLRHLGTRGQVPLRLLELLDRAGTATAAGNGLKVNLGICYGGREEFTDACRALLGAYAAQGLSPAQAARRVTTEGLSEVVSAGFPPPDLVIRTSGEHRSSGFLLWSATHTEYWFTSTYWPDFDKDDLAEALAYYARSRTPGNDPVANA